MMDDIYENINDYNPSRPNEHTTSNPRRFDVDITWIRWKPNFEEFPRHFRVPFRCNFDGYWCIFTGRKIHIVSTYFFWQNFAGQKVHVVSTYSFWCNFDGGKIHVVSVYFYQCYFAGRKIHVVSTYVFQCNFNGRKIHVVSTYFYWCDFEICTLFLLTFFDVILMSKNPTSFLASCKLMKTFEKVFYVFATLNNWFLQDCFP